MAILFRPVGLKELALIWDLGCRAFPPRLPHQPYFYPVTNYEYAKQIARDWNVKDEASVFCGFVTRFEVADSYLSGFKPHVVGSSLHEEYWIPANELSEFNRAIQSRISIEAAFFGPTFEGYVPARGALKGKPAPQQFLELARVWEFNSVEFMSEVSVNRKAIYLNDWFWAQHDFSARGIRPEQKQLMFERLEGAWTMNHIEPPWPTEELNRTIALCGSKDSVEHFSGRWRNAMSRAGAPVDNIDSEEQLAIQEDFRQTVQEQRTKRPTGVTVVAIGLFLWAVLYLVLLGIGFTISAAGAKPGYRNAGLGLAMISVLFAPIRIAFLTALGTGIWRVRRWARRTLLLYAGVIVALNLLNWRGLTMGREIEVLLCIVTMAYLSSKRASAAFESGVQSRA